MTQPTAASFVDVMRRRAQQHPHRTAFTMLGGDGTPASALSFLELHDRAAAIGQHLLELGLVPGDRALLLFPAGLEFIATYLGCLLARVIAVPAYPPLRDTSTLERIVSDCSPKLIVCSDEIRKRLLERFPDSALHRRNPVHLPADLKPAADAEFGEVGSDVIASLQYTSGSTGTPKGVVISHLNLMNNLAAIQQRFGAGDESIAVSWLPMYHDMGLMGGVLGSLYCGTQTYLISPQDFMREPVSWLRAISKYKASISGGPNFAYQHCIDRVHAEAARDLDLSSWKVAFNGAEPVRAQVLERFAEKFDKHGFSRKALMPCYGMAEATLLVSSVPIDALPLVQHIDARELESGRAAPVGRHHAAATTIVSCGELIEGHRMRIVDPASRLSRPDGQVGEIWLSGPSMASSYWNDPTGAGFRDRLADGDAGGPDAYFRTGDLGYCRDGQLYVTGRLKDLIIVRGRNHYPQDLEAVAGEAHPAFSADAAIAFQLEQREGGGLVLLLEVRRSELRRFDATGAFNAVRAALANHAQLQLDSVVFLGPQRLPRTSSGKVQRSAGKRLFEAQELEPVAAFLGQGAGAAADGAADSAGRLAAGADNTGNARSAVELEVCGILARHLRLRPDAVPCDRPLIDLGIDSLSQLELSHVLLQRFKVDVRVEHYFDGLTVRQFAQKVEGKVADAWAVAA